MIFFKHFVNAHSGESGAEIRAKGGLEAYGAFMMLLELCAAKMHKERDAEYTLDDCRFVFQERDLRELFRLRSARVRFLLDLYATTGSLEWTLDGQKLRIYIPNFLKFLDKDSKRPRPARGRRAASARLEGEIEIEKEEEAPPAFPKKKKPRAPTLKVVGRQSEPAPALPKAALEVLEADILNVVAIGDTLKSAYEQVCGAKPPPSVLQLSPRIYEHYSDPEDFAAWLEAKCNSDAVRKARDPAQYLTRVLTLEFGATL